jgi:hypothetical protein
MRGAQPARSRGVPSLEIALGPGSATNYFPRRPTGNSIAHRLTCATNCDARTFAKCGNRALSRRQEGAVAALTTFDF